MENFATSVGQVTNIGLWASMYVQCNKTKIGKIRQPILEDKINNIENIWQTFGK